MMKVDIESFGYNNLQDFKFMKTIVEFKVLNKVIITDTFNVDFHNKLIKFRFFSYFIPSDLISLFTSIFLNIYTWCLQ